MIKRLGHIVFATAFLLLMNTASAETAYITDTVTVAIFPNADLQGEPLERLLSSALVDVLQKSNGVAKVETKSGKTGWLRADFLATSLPAAIKLENAQHELSKANSELKTLRDKVASLEKSAEAAKKDASQNVGWMRAELDKARKKAAELEEQMKKRDANTSEARQQSGELETQLASLKQEKEDLEQRLAAAMMLEGEAVGIAAGEDETSESGFPWSLVLLLVGLAAGFAGGYYWLDQRVRRRFGGVRVY